MFGCSKGIQKPIWINQLPDNPLLYQAVGVASSEGNPQENWKSAEQNARAELAARIEVQIFQVLTSMVNAQSKDEQETISASFRKVTKSVVSQSLPDSRIVARYNDPKSGEYWVLAAIDRDVIERLMSERVQKSKDLLLSHYQTALKKLKEKDIFSAFEEYAKALTAANNDHMQFVRLDLNGDGTEEYPLPFLQREVKDILDRVQMEIVSGDEQTGTQGEGLAVFFVLKVFYKDEKPLRPGGQIEIPLNNAPITFEFIRGDGGLDADVLTDERGIAKSKVYSISFATGMNIVEARLNLSVAGLIKEYKKVSRRFTFKSQSPQENIAIAVKLIEKGTGISSPIVATKIVEALAENRYQVKDIKLDDARIENLIKGGSLEPKPKVDILIVGKIETAFSSDNRGYFLSYRANGVIKAVEIKKGKVIFALDIANVKGFGNTKEKASLNALTEAAAEVAEDVIEKLKKGARG